MIETIIKYAGFYIGIGFLFAIYETIKILNKGKKHDTMNRIKITVGWLPAIFSDRVSWWLMLKKRQ